MRRELLDRSIVDKNKEVKPKQLTISSDVHLRLSILKTKNGFKTLSDTIEYLLNRG